MASRHPSSTNFKNAMMTSPPCSCPKPESIRTVTGRVKSPPYSSSHPIYSTKHRRRKRRRRRERDISSAGVFIREAPKIGSGPILLERGGGLKEQGGKKEPSFNTDIRGKTGDSIPFPLSKVGVSKEGKGRLQTNLLPWWRAWKLREG